MVMQKITVQAQDIRTFSLEKKTSAPGSTATGGGTLTTGYAPVGSRQIPAGEAITVTITGFQFSTPIPAVVLLQARQGDNQEFGFADEFATQVISTASDRIICRLRRLDRANAGGWGQHLRLDLLVVEAGS